MSAGLLPQTTVAIILGAQDFEKADLASDSAFAKSASAMKALLLEEEGFGLPETNLLDLFDDERSPSAVDHEIDKFLATRTASAEHPDKKIQDLIVYYTGHGAFDEGDSFGLALRCTVKNRIAMTAYRIDGLAQSLKRHVRSCRRFVILDCCFAGSAYAAFQSSVTSVVQRSNRLFAKRGTSLLCASACDRPAKIRTSAGDTATGMTLFSECLTEVLSCGIRDVTRSRLTLREIGLEVEALMNERFDGEGPRPEVKSPDERDGDPASAPLFPNNAFSPVTDGLSNLILANDHSALTSLQNAQPNNAGVTIGSAELANGAPAKVRSEPVENPERVHRGASRAAVFVLFLPLVAVALVLGLYVSSDTGIEEHEVVAGQLLSSSSGNTLPTAETESPPATVAPDLGSGGLGEPEAAEATLNEESVVAEQDPPPTPARKAPRCQLQVPQSAHPLAPISVHVGCAWPRGKIRRGKIECAKWVLKHSGKNLRSGTLKGREMTQKIDIVAQEYIGDMDLKLVVKFFDAEGVEINGSTVSRTIPVH